MKACLNTRRYAPIKSMPCRCSRPNWRLGLNAMQSHSRKSPAFRRCSTFHLGLGPDGHTASLVPGDPVLNVTDSEVALTGIYQGRRRMTLTYPILNRASSILWLVTGKDKVAALARLREGDVTIPAGRIQRDNALVLADQVAAGPL